MNKIVDTILKIQNNKNINTLLNSLLKEQKQAQTALDNLLAAIEQGVVNHTTNNRMKELENKIQELEKQILIERSKGSQQLTKQQIMDYYLAGLKLERKLLIDYLIKDIIVYDDKIEIKFNSPTKISPEPQGFSFNY